MQHYGSTELDASLLLLPLVGFLPADDPRVAATVEESLTEDGLVPRHRTEGGTDGLEGDEGTFLLCNFWLVHAEGRMLGNSRRPSPTSGWSTPPGEWPPRPPTGDVPPNDVGSVTGASGPGAR